MKKKTYNYIFVQYLIVFFLVLLLVFSLIDSPKEVFSQYPGYYYSNFIYLLFFSVLGIVFTFVFTIFYKMFHNKIKYNE